MRLGFFGSPEIAAALLRALVEKTNHQIVGVVSNPDRPVGRSGKAQPTPVSSYAQEQGLPLFRFETLRDGQATASLSGLEADLFVVFAYGRLLPEDVIALPKFGTVNLHGSLLPELRGASPIASAILRGLQTTGWTLQSMVKELDAGDILATTAVNIDPLETAGELTERMLPMGIDLVLQSLADFPAVINKRTKQDPARVTHCSKFTVEMSWIDWSRPAEELHNFVRALSPWPVARTRLEGSLVRVTRTLLPGAENQLPWQPPGRLWTMKSGGMRRLFVGTGTQLLEIAELQPENKRSMKAGDFLNGVRLGEQASFERSAN